MDRRMDVWWTDGRTDGQTDGLTDDQSETIIPRHYCVRGIKKTQQFQAQILCDIFWQVHVCRAGLHVAYDNKFWFPSKTHDNKLWFSSKTHDNKFWFLSKIHDNKFWFLHKILAPQSSKFLKKVILAIKALSKIVADNILFFLL